MVCYSGRVVISLASEKARVGLEPTIDSLPGNCLSHLATGPYENIESQPRLELGIPSVQRRCLDSSWLLALDALFFPQSKRTLALATM